MLVQKHKDKRAAQRCLRKTLKPQGMAPRRMVTDKLRSLFCFGRHLWRAGQYRAVRSRALTTWSEVTCA